MTTIALKMDMALNHIFVQYRFQLEASKHLLPRNFSSHDLCYEFCVTYIYVAKPAKGTTADGRGASMFQSDVK